MTNDRGLPAPCFWSEWVGNSSEVEATGRRPAAMWAYGSLAQLKDQSEIYETTDRDF